MRILQKDVCSVLLLTASGVIVKRGSTTLYCRADMSRAGLIWQQALADARSRYVQSLVLLLQVLARVCGAMGKTHDSLQLPLPAGLRYHYPGVDNKFTKMTNMSSGGLCAFC